MDLDENLKQFKNASPEQKIVVLRMEMIPPLTMIKGCADLIKYGVATSPHDVETWAQQILGAVDRLQQLREILYDDEH